MAKIIEGRKMELDGSSPVSHGAKIKLHLLINPRNRSVSIFIILLPMHIYCAVCTNVVLKSIPKHFLWCRRTVLFLNQQC